MKRLLFLGAAIACAAMTREAKATDYYVEGNVSGGGSTWGSADPNVQGALRTGFEFLDIISVDLQGRLGYASVDERMLMMVGLGTKLALPIEPFIPHIRLQAIHFHESPVDVMKHDPFMHAMGVGDGIRHRFGFEAGLGASYLFAKVKRANFLAQMEGYVDAFPDDGKGPVVYGGAGLGVGMQYGL
ncbi:MAG: hypothetical protein HOV80_22890 [Polyangiaceae bacterium]|nr:hypothetical protein [Polyangiaceae bacterium]